MRNSPWFQSLLNKRRAGTFVPGKKALETLRLILSPHQTRPQHWKRIVNHGARDCPNLTRFGHVFLGTLGRQGTL
jgi:hypothetical protein